MVTTSDAKKRQNTINYECKTCNFVCCKKSELSRHIVTAKHIKMNNSDTHVTQKRLSIIHVNYAKKIIIQGMDYGFIRKNAVYKIQIITNQKKSIIKLLTYLKNKNNNNKN